MCRRQPRVVGCSPNTVKAAVASLWAAEVRPGCNRVAGGCVRKIRELFRGVSADAGDGESRSGSASRSDSLIEFVKTMVAILPLLILTATTGSDEPSLRAERPCGGWFLDRLELGVDRRRAVG
jgi:hypothetical protein